MKIPTGHQMIMPYIILNNAAEFIEFTKKVFNAELTHHKLRENEHWVMHAEVVIDGSTIMFCDATERWQSSAASLFIYVANADATFRRAIDHGATVIMDLNDQEYGRTCGIADPSGNVWWVTSL